MINPLARATRGRIRQGTTKGTLVLAVAGMLFFSFIDTTTTTSTLQPVVKPAITQIISSPGTTVLIENNWRDLVREDEELMLIIKMFLKCQN